MYTEFNILIIDFSTRMNARRMCECANARNAGMVYQVNKLWLDFWIWWRDVIFFVKPFFYFVFLFTKNSSAISMYNHKEPGGRRRQASMQGQGPTAASQ